MRAAHSLPRLDAAALPCCVPRAAAHTTAGHLRSDPAGRQCADPAAARAAPPGAGPAHARAPPCGPAAAADTSAHARRDSLADASADLRAAAASTGANEGAAADAGAAARRVCLLCRPGRGGPVPLSRLWRRQAGRRRRRRGSVDACALRAQLRGRAHHVGWRRVAPYPDGVARALGAGRGRGAGRSAL